jgi:hypothetical protein
MTQTTVLNGFEEIPELLAGIQEDFEDIDYADYLYRELDLMADLHKSFFDQSKGPDGATWDPNAPSTVRQKGHAVILRGVRGRQEKSVKGTKNRPRVRFSRGRKIGGYRLATSLTAKTRQSFGDAIREGIATHGGGAMTFGSAVEYAGDKGAGRVTAYAPQGRPHVGMNEQHLDKMTERAADYTLEQLAR